jgi:hypothetical protein
MNLFGLGGCPPAAVNPFFDEFGVKFGTKTRLEVFVFGG